VFFIFFFTPCIPPFLPPLLFPPFLLPLPLFFRFFRSVVPTRVIILPTLIQPMLCDALFSPPVLGLPQDPFTILPQGSLYAPVFVLHVSVLSIFLSLGCHFFFSSLHPFPCTEALSCSAVPLYPGFAPLPPPLLFSLSFLYFVLPVTCHALSFVCAIFFITVSHILLCLSVRMARPPFFSP